MRERERERERERDSWSSRLGSHLWIGRSRDRGSPSHFLFNRTFTQGLKIIGEKAFHLAYAAYMGPLVYPQLALLRESQCTWVYSH